MLKLFKTFIFWLSVKPTTATAAAATSAAFVHPDFTDKHLNEALFLVWPLVVLVFGLWSRSWRYQHQLQLSSSSSQLHPILYIQIDVRIIQILHYFSYGFV